MRDRLFPELAGLLPRLPVSLLGLAIALASAQAACSGTYEGEPPAGTEGSDLDASPGDAQSDGPSQDSDADRADGMSYGDGYGKEDASGDASGR
ncbi:MAG TPA: hypothetical protein VGG39_27690 [Polyangiaceae bacterium]|jgi:hypothetical protein